MALFNFFRFDNLNDLLVMELQELYDTEQRLIDALPKMADAATTPALRDAFKQHYSQTQTQAQRLEQIFGKLGCPTERQTSSAMRGLISDGEDIISARGNNTVRDAALIAAAQQVEHYEIATYGTARTLAQQLGLTDVANTLQKTLEEEAETDKKLTHLAESSINVSSPASAQVV